ncbi:MAG TPA: NAD(P)H-hydrate dehydratase, partial [Acidimicrobiales bacterium]|nr:NAD(P)H-hydrate dehydratase [Acidimicrobiales bacterium]
MIPVLTPAEMKAVDEAATDGVDVLVARAGAAVARSALGRLGGGYGRRVVVVAGKGNNGADGRAAAVRLRRRGARVEVLDAAGAPDRLPSCDLVVDAAYGTGFRGDYAAPDPGAAPVLAVDIPSGVDGLTGEATPGAVRATWTVTFAALKPGLLLAGDRTGPVTVADIGLDVSGARMHAVEAADVRARLPPRNRAAHKYAAAVLVVAGSPGMSGAAALTAGAVLRAGAGYCRLGVPGAGAAAGSGTRAPLVTEAVEVDLPADGWSAAALEACTRMGALAVGPGLGRGGATRADVCRLLAGAPVPAVVDADALHALGTGDEAAAVLAGRGAPTVVTPHNGEFARLAGRPPGPDPVAATRALAALLGATVLLKGPVTVVADPGGEVLLATSGTPVLATAGTGDVLTGVVAAFLARGLSPLEAAGLAACAHGEAARLGHP